LKSDRHDVARRRPRLVQAQLQAIAKPRVLAQASVSGGAASSRICNLAVAAAAAAAAAGVPPQTRRVPRRRLQEPVKRLLEGQQRILREDARKSKALLEIGEAEASQRKRTRRVELRTASGGRLRSGADDPTDEQKSAASPHLAKRKKLKATVGSKRGRNMFFKLLGHLHSAAKHTLQSDAGTKRKIKARLKAVSREEGGSVVLERQQERGDEQQKKADNHEEMLRLQRRLESHYSLMMNFIRTKAEPTIFYLPAKHIKETEQALEETRAAIKHKIASLKEVLEGDGAEGAGESGAVSGSE